jgi:hypothetical protein
LHILLLPLLLLPSTAAAALRCPGAAAAAKPGSYCTAAAAVWHAAAHRKCQLLLWVSQGPASPPPVPSFSCSTSWSCASIMRAMLRLLGSCSSPAGGSTAQHSTAQRVRQDGIQYSKIQQAHKQGIDLVAAKAAVLSAK